MFFSTLPEPTLSKFNFYFMFSIILEYVLHHKEWMGKQIGTQNELVGFK